MATKLSQAATSGKPNAVLLGSVHGLLARGVDDKIDVDVPFSFAELPLSIPYVASGFGDKSPDSETCVA